MISRNLHISMNIKHISLVFALLLGAQTSLRAGTDDITRAMRDELQRSLSQLALPTLQRPYYIEYTLTMRDAQNMKASLGGVVHERHSPTATLSVGIRVGKQEFDNTNYFDVSLGFFGSSDDEEGFKNRRVPLELDYAALRREIWLASDAAYKQAAELYAKKEASIKNRLRTDTTPDFKLLPQQTLADTGAIPGFDANYFRQLCKDLSSVFKEYSSIAASSVGVEFTPERVYYVNSEGREYQKTEYYAGLEVVASTQASDGMPLANVYSCYTQNPANFPSKDSLMKAVQATAATLNRMTFAPTLADGYSGPVLFEDQAAAEVMAQVFTPNLVAQRSPLTERGMQESDRYSAFQNKIGGRVLPEFLSIVATPDKPMFNTTSLIGSYTIDDDGIPAQQVNLVENGYLKTLLTSRIPTKKLKQSNGHQRGGAAMLSTIELRAKPEKKADKQLDANALRQKMMKICKDRDLPFGLIIRKVLNQNILFTALYEQTAGEYPFAQGDTKLSLLEVYKVYPNGKEELIRGSEGAGFTVQAFKDIIAVGKKQSAYNYLAPAIASPFVTGGAQYIGSSIIVPDILFEDVEIRPLEGDFPKPPFLASPLGKK